MQMPNYLEKLLDGVEVEWKALGEVCKVFNGYAFQSKLFNAEGDGLPIIRIRDVNTGFSETYYSGGYDKRYLVADGDILIGMDGDFRVVRWKHGRALLNQRVCRLQEFTPEMLPDFMYYLVQDELDRIHSKIQGSTVKHLSSRELEQSIIPVPPLDVQGEIVRILDTFTELTAELTAELNLRKQQYQYYRDQLLTFEEGEVEWKTLGELAENLDSKRKPITSGLREAGNIPYYGASGIVDYVKDYIFDGDFLLVSEDGANLLARNTPIAFSISGKTWVNNHAHVLKFDTYAERRYVEYYLNSIDLTPYISGAAQPKLNKKNLESIRIPNPSPTEKERIVAILDKFDTLVNSLTEGLPREIELRQQQYEYYRDLLLSFPKPDEAA
ncbi:MAG: restriction endonuclease [Oceanospirillales bacterium]|nr:restriction endonuclease [Marinobacter sp.]MBI44200.1 restriction endonuclease [Oceanospirillales bacterium]|tara:strand:- start:7800 stop:8951 length:1152 start_codon:yes stop_codon:yes gene_type:complete